MVCDCVVERFVVAENTAFISLAFAQVAYKKKFLVDSDQLKVDNPSNETVLV